MLCFMDPPPPPPPYLVFLSQLGRSAGRSVAGDAAPFLLLWWMSGVVVEAPNYRPLYALTAADHTHMQMLPISARVGVPDLPLLRVGWEKR